MERPPLSSRGSDIGLVPGGQSQHVYSLNSIDMPFAYENYIEDDSTTTHQGQMSARTHAMWPSLVACIPMVLLCGALLALIFGYEIRPIASIYSPYLTPSEYYKSDYLLVRFSDTKIVFLASFLSTLAPMLAGCLMSLASISLIRKYYALPRAYRTSSASASDHHALLSALFSGSYGSLVRSCKYLIRKKNTKTPPIIFYATTLLLLTVFMSIAVAVADAALHVFTKTVSFTLYSPETPPSYEHGRGLNSLCLNFNRVADNLGFPCTNQMVDNSIDPNGYEEAAEAQKLSHNTSTIQTIQFFNASGTNRSDLVYLTPAYTTVDPNLDYKATTIGVSSKCSIIPVSLCNVTRWGPYYQAYTNFNCSAKFWGTLGLAQNVTPINSDRVPSKYLPFLSIKPQSNLQYGFYNDTDLHSVYNPAGLNDSALPDPKLQPIPDAKLPTSLYWAFAWRSSWASFIGGEDNEMISSNLTGVYPDTYYLDFFLNCEITALNVEYAWVNGTVDTNSIVATTMSNGTALNMWQGTTTYGPSISGGGHVYQDIHTQAAVAGTTIASYESRFGALLGQQVLGKIGGYTSSRTVLQQQMRQSLLLAKIPKASLGALVGCSLLYPVLGLILLYKARRSVKKDASKPMRQFRIGHPSQPLYSNNNSVMAKNQTSFPLTPTDTIGTAIPMTKSPTSTVSKPRYYQAAVHEYPSTPGSFMFNNTLDPGSVYDLTTTTAIPTSHHTSPPPISTRTMMTTTYDQNGVSTSKSRDRNSTAAFRSVLWGSAGAGPNFDHLKSDDSHVHGYGGNVI